MKRKPIRIDWDELLAAFDNKDAELVYYVDRVTGHVLLEGQDSDDEEEPYDATATAAPPRRDDRFRAYIEPLSNELKLAWLRVFVADADSAELDDEFAAALKEAMASPTPVEDVIDVLNRFPEGKDTWYAYRTDRVQEHIDGWIADQGIDFTDPPPWRE